MNKVREINNYEKEIILKHPLQSFLSFKTIIYVVCVLLPFLVLFFLTMDIIYLILLLMGLIILVVYLLINVSLFTHNILSKKVNCYESKILSCKKSPYYYYLIEINDSKGNYIPFKYAVSKRLKEGDIVNVIMINGKSKYCRYIILDKDRKILSSKRTRLI